MFVIGTAGHVDHGKSTLIKALTGMDPDRLQEEKERGMTIDLGFAWLRLPSGREVSIVDVPGHERFIKNMLAGVGGIDMALLVVAADEGVMPQTEEHLAIIDLLQVRQGVVALTKSDLVDSDWLALVTEDVRARLAGTTLSEAPIIPVSSTSRAGLKDLLAILDRLLNSAQPRRDIGRPRLSIDRAFTIAGFGTVVTGTLIDGKLVAGQEVEIIPVARQGKTIRSRVRGLQTHKKKEEQAYPGTRVAINLANIEVDDVQRGDVVTTPGWLEPTSLVDVRLRLVKNLAQPLEHNALVTVHTGAAEAEARLSLLQANEQAPGSSGWAQLRLEQPLAVVRGDFFIIRSPNATLGGGKIVDSQARRHRRFDEQVAAGLERLAQGTPEDLILQTLGAQPPMEAGAALEKVGLPFADALTVLQQLLAKDQVLMLGESALTPRSIIVSAPGWAELVDHSARILAAYHRQFPLRRGMPQEELKSRLALPARIFAASLEKLSSEASVAIDDNVLRLPGHHVQFSAGQQVTVDRFLHGLAQTPYAPPTRPEMIAQLGEEMLAALFDQNRLVKVTEDVIFGSEAYQAMVDGVLARINERGRTNVADVRDLFNTSRRYAIALLEHLDQQHITRREGDDRVLAS